MKIVLKALGAAAAAGSVFAWMSLAMSAKILEASIGAVLALLLVGSLLFLDKIPRIRRDRIAPAGLGILGGLAASYFAAGILTADMQIFLPVVVITLVIGGCIAGITAAGQPRAAGAGGGSTAFVEPVTGAGIKDKILDTSIVIDGRILDIATTNFIEGAMIIPNFVLREIQLISDSPDPVKRNRGRRGLEMLNKLQQLDNVKVKISYVDYADARDVDAKLVRMARETGGKLITNDFNLNKVAELQGVEVLNLNTLTSALKPVVLPGEEIIIDVIKEGKDENQGIGYLEDGTMVVVENGRQLLGKTVKVVVTSIIQTAAGKMIFTRATGAVEQEEDDRRRGQNAGGRRDGRDNQNRDNREYRDRDDREFSRGGRRR